MDTQELQQKSFQFIEKNPNVTFNELPNELLYHWLVDDPEEYLNSEYENKHEYTVFMYALIYFHKNKGLSKFEMNVEQLQEYFITFQTLLAFAEINKKTEIRIAPIKLFDFDNYDNIKASFTRLER